MAFSTPSDVPQTQRWEICNLFSSFPACQPDSAAPWYTGRAMPMRRSEAARRNPLRRLLAFPVLRPSRARPAVSPSESEVLFELEGRNPENRLFGRYDEGDVLVRLHRSGILERLRER